jgi:DNA-binding LacI/PurR family transcriptional regulator
VLQQGETAATLLLDRMLDGDGEYEPTSVVIPTKLIVRSTTGPVRDRSLQ